MEDERTPKTVEPDDKAPAPDSGSHEARRTGDERSGRETLREAKEDSVSKLDQQERGRRIAP